MEAHVLGLSQPTLGAPGTWPVDTGETKPSRRILYNLDGDSCMTLIGGRPGAGPVNSNDLVRIVSELTAPGSQVDTLLLCLNAQVTYYPSRTGTMRGTRSTPAERAAWPRREQQRFENIQAFYDAGVDPYAVIFAEAKRRGLETLITFRMNDAHGNDFLRTAFWQDHPDFQLPNGALDFSSDAVRNYVFELIEEAVQRYPCDGVELDFQRFPSFFKSETRESLEARIQKIDRLVERIRLMLDVEGARRNHRLLLSARLPSGYGLEEPTYEKSRALGCNPAEWANRGWIDFLTVSEWLFTSKTLKVSAWKQHVGGVPIYAAMQPETQPSLSESHCDYCLGAEGYRQYARERWADGADGIYLFNFFTTREWPEPVEPPYQVLSQLAGPTCGGPWPELRAVHKIWDGAPHNAFTDLVHDREHWFCVFREGSAHIPGTNGVIRVLRSGDGSQWESVALVTENGVDLRDPKLCTMPDGRFMLLMGGSIYRGPDGMRNREFLSAQTRVSFSTDGRTWSDPQPVSVKGEWLWRVTWHDHAGYGLAYSVDASKESHVSLWRTVDGVHYEKIASPPFPSDCWPSEGTLRFLPDSTMVALVRNEKNKGHAFLGRSKPPYTSWEWKDSSRVAQGPNFLLLPGNKIFYAGREYQPHPVTAFGFLSDTVRPMAVPSGGDTSYPGLIWHEGRIWMSYYSSHEGRSSIYLAEIGLPEAR